MIDQNLVDELRRMFLDGATPSRLMRHIANQHPDDPRLHFLITDYFREAFGIPLVRTVGGREDYSPDRRHAHFIRELVPEMIQRIGDWNTESVEGSWVEGVSVCSVNEHSERLRSVRFEELNRVWDTLNDKEKRFIIRKSARIDYGWDAMKCLAKLAERLQQQVVELEERLRSERQARTSFHGEGAPRTGDSGHSESA